MYKNTWESQLLAKQCINYQVLWRMSLIYLRKITTSKYLSTSSVVFALPVWFCFLPFIAHFFFGTLCTRTYDSLEVTRKIKLTHCTVRIVSMLCENGAGLIFNYDWCSWDNIGEWCNLTNQTKSVHVDCDYYVHTCTCSPHFITITHTHQRG